MLYQQLVEHVVQPAHLHKALVCAMISVATVNGNHSKMNRDET
jgi:hypothetical protein